MIRRRYLGAVGAGAISLVAGCSGDGDNGGNQDQENDTNMNSSTAETTQQRDVDVVIDSAEWGDDGLVELFVENNGEDRSGRVVVTARWFDEQGNFLGHDSGGVRTLEGDGTWWEFIQPSVEWHPVEEFELFVDYGVRPPTPPEGMEVRETELVDDPAITGLIENSRSEPMAVEAIGVIYDTGWMLNTPQVSQSGIPANTDWRFRIPLPVRGPDRVSNYEVLLHDPTL